MSTPPAITADWLRANPEWLRTLTDQQLPGYRADFARMRAGLEQADTVRDSDIAAAHFIAEYLVRASGYDAALEFLDVLDRKHPLRVYYVNKVTFLQQQERKAELNDYLDELAQRNIGDAHFPVLCLQASLGLEQRERAGFWLTKLIAEQPQSGYLLKALIFATVFGLEFDRAELARQVPWGRIFLALQERITGQQAAGSVPLVYCINLDRSARRLARCNELYQGRAELVRVPAIPGDALPGDLLQGININPELPASAVGCSLSHQRAWEQVAAGAESGPAAILVEDDGLPLWLGSALSDALQDMMQQQELDLLYIHGSATALGFALREYSPAWQPAAMSFQAGLDRFVQHRQPLLPGWGMFGYCLSVSGARKLLALVRRDGMTNHIDWQTFLYSVSDWNHPVARSKQNVVVNYQSTCGRMPKCELNTGILNFPVIEHIDFARSSR